MKYNKPIQKEDFNQLINLPLKEKIKISQEIITEFMENIPQEQVYISSSFGKDSITLINLVRNLYPETTIVYVNTGMEQPSCMTLSEKYENVLRITPKMNMEEIIEKYGYILPLGKEKSNTIAAVRKNLYDGKYNTVRVKKMRGDFGKDSLFNFSKWQHVILAPFPISDKCCHYLKIEPFNRVKKKYGYNYLFTGVEYSESRMRRNNLINHGFITKQGQCRPIGHWNSQDVLQYILDEKLELPDCYGEIINVDGKLTTSQFKRTGCICCPIGAHLEKRNDYQTLYKYNPLLWDYVINKLGFRQVLDYFNIDYTGESLEENLPEDYNLDKYMDGEDE